MYRDGYAELSDIERALRSDPDFARDIEELRKEMRALPASRFTVEAATMQRFLDGVYAGFGGARAWALGAGVDAGDLDRMRSDLLEPAG